MHCAMKMFFSMDLMYYSGDVSSMFECSVFTVTPLEGPYLEFYVNEVELHIH